MYRVHPNIFTNPPPMYSFFYTYITYLCVSGLPEYMFESPSMYSFMYTYIIYICVYRFHANLFIGHPHAFIYLYVHYIYLHVYRVHPNIFMEGVRLGVWVVVLVVCVCVGVGGAVFCRCVCVCDLLIFLRPNIFTNSPPPPGSRPRR